MLSTQRSARDVLDPEPAVVGLAGDGAELVNSLHSSDTTHGRPWVRVVEGLEHTGVRVVVMVLGGVPERRRAAPTGRRSMVNSVTRPAYAPRAVAPLLPLMRARCAGSACGPMQASACRRAGTPGLGRIGIGGARLTRK